MTAPRIPQKPMLQGVGKVGSRLAAVPPKPAPSPAPPAPKPFLDVKAVHRAVESGALNLAPTPATPVQKLLQAPDKTKSAFVGAGKANAAKIEFVQMMQNKADKQAAAQAQAQAQAQGQDPSQPQQQYDQGQQQAGGYYDQGGAYYPQQDSGGYYGYPSQGGSGGGQAQDSGQKYQDQGTQYEYTEDYSQNAPSDSVTEELHAAVTGPLQNWESDIDFQELNGFAGEQEYADDSRTRAAFTEFHNGRVSTVATCRTPWGIVPIVDSQRVTVGSEEGVAHAMNVSADRLAQKAQAQNLQLAAEDLVIRARQGDQNAMGLIVAIRENAKKGNPRAQQSVQLLQSYIAKNPPEDKPTFSAEKQKSNILMSATIALADGPNLTMDRLQQLAATFGSEKESNLFLYALVNFKNGELLHALGNQLGKLAQKIIQYAQTVGTARTLQMVRTPGVPISVYSAEAGWEHGE